MLGLFSLVLEDFRTAWLLAEDARGGEEQPRSDGLLCPLKFLGLRDREE